MNTNQFVRRLLTEQIQIGPSLTVSIPVVPYQVSAVLKYITGGSLLINGSTFTVNGTVYGGSSYVVSMQYLMGGTEALNLLNFADGLTLSTVGATVVCALVRGLNLPAGVSASPGGLAAQ